MKRFYKDAVIGVAGDCFHILLDSRQVRTPARNVLTLPTAALAEVVAEEWRAQGDEIVPASMPMLRLANTVQDGVASNRAEIIAAILRFGAHDVICYRAEAAPELLRRQRESWDPLLDWASAQLGARLAVTQGVNHIAQSADAMKALERAVTREDDYGLAALHVMASITGSLVLALALVRGALNSAQAFQLSRLDEDFQAQAWGADREAQTRAHALARELDVAARFLSAARS